MNATIKMKNLEIDLVTERRMRIALETDLKVERKTALKLREKLDNLLAAEVKSGKVLERMKEKVRMKRDEKDAKFSHLHAVVDRAIAMKGRGRGRGSCLIGEKKGKVSNDKEWEAKKAFENWKMRGVGDGEYSDNSDSLGEYTSNESSSSPSSSSSSSIYDNRQKRRKNSCGKRRGRVGRGRRGGAAQVGGSRRIGRVETGQRSTVFQTVLCVRVGRIRKRREKEQQMELMMLLRRVVSLDIVALQ